MSADNNSPAPTARAATRPMTHSAGCGSTSSKRCAGWGSTRIRSASRASMRPPNSIGAMPNCRPARKPGPRPRRRPHPRDAQQRHVHRPARRLGQNPDFFPQGLSARRRTAVVEAARYRRSDRGRGSGAAHAQGRADRQRRARHDAGQGAAALAREISRAGRYRAALPPALSRPDHEPAEPRDLAPPQPHRRGDARLADRARLSRSRDADAAHDPRRRRGASRS